MKYLLFPPLLALLLAVSACTSAPATPARQYLLPAATRPAVATQVPDLSLHLAGYLDQGGIVLRSSPVTITTARQHRWADPLADQLLRALRYHLSQDGVPAEGQLSVTVIRFQGSGDGHAEVAGHWHYRNDRGIDKSGRFQTHRALQQDGYDALVTQLDAAWAAVAADISATLTP